MDKVTLRIHHNHEPLSLHMFIVVNDVYHHILTRLYFLRFGIRCRTPPTPNKHPTPKFES
jgi:hypothetical protein